MKKGRPKTEKWHSFDEGDARFPIDRHGKHLKYFKKGFWKKYDRKKFYRTLLKSTFLDNGE